MAARRVCSAKLAHGQPISDQTVTAGADTARCPLRSIPATLTVPALTGHSGGWNGAR